MAYMSYCRHEGTLSELRICLDDAIEHVNEEAQYEVSSREIECFKHIITEVYDFMNDMSLLNSDGELDFDELENICEAMSKSYDAEDDE